MLKPLTDSGLELDAGYSVELAPGGFDIIVESRGGADRGQKGAARNSDYAPALEQHLSRMSAFGMVLVQVQVASTVAERLPEQNRTVALDRFAIPLTLSPSINLQELRLSIGRASAAFGREDGADRGNRTKRMRLRMQWSAAATMTEHEIEKMLGRPIIPATNEEPTADPIELQKAVERAYSQLRAMTKFGLAQPPKGQVVPPRSTGMTGRFVRDPNVIAWVLKTAAGHCEICGKPAPFLTEAGEPFLEVHHVRPLGEGGPDTPDNAVASCPNCHRQLHHDPKREAIKQRAIGTIQRLGDYPHIAESTLVADALVLE